jgi:hypothetical protein
LKTTDPTKIPVLERMADAYEEEGCTGVAYQLREYAKGLKGQPAVQQTPVEEPTPAKEATPEAVAEVVH